MTEMPEGATEPPFQILPKGMPAKAPRIPDSDWARSVRENNEVTNLTEHDDYEPPDE